MESEKQMGTLHAAKMKSIPKMRLNFSLTHFKLVLMNSEQHSGLQTYTDGFSV